MRVTFRCSTWAPVSLQLLLPLPNQSIDFLKRKVTCWVLLPLPEVEVPPLVAVDGEALCLHRSPQQLAVPALQRRPAREVRVGAVGHLVVAARHLDRLAGLHVVQRKSDAAAASVPRALHRVP